MTTCCGILLGAWTASGEDVRYYQGENGLTYKETRRIVRRPITTTDWQERQQTVYRQELRSNTRDYWQTYHSPVTEYQWLSRLHGRWNPFVVPYYTHHLVPVTRWEPRAQVVQVPSWRAEWVPETRTVRVPVSTQRMAEEEVITRVAVSGPPTTTEPRRLAAQPAPAPITNVPPAASSWPAASSRPPPPRYGGVVLPGDPPRHATGWRSRGETQYR